MKQLFFFITTLVTFQVSAQSAREHFRVGTALHEKQDFRGAASAYSKAIEADKNFADAYLNRGACEIALGESTAAMADINKAIGLDSVAAKAYYIRATAWLGQQRYQQAMDDLNKCLGLNAAITEAMNLRGQVHIKLGNKQAGCDDLYRSKTAGDKDADKLIKQYCAGMVPVNESLLLRWPKEEHWKVGSKQENKQMSMVEMIHEDESLEKWTEFGSMMTILSVRHMPMDKAMSLMYDEAKKGSPGAKLTLVEKNDTAEYPWIIFAIETPSYKDDQTPESQLWYIVQGKRSLYTNFRAVKQPALSAELKEKWTAFFKTGRIVNQ